MNLSQIALALLFILSVEANHLIAGNPRKVKMPRADTAGPDNHGHIGWKSTAEEVPNEDYWNFTRTVINKDKLRNCWINWPIAQIDTPVKPEQQLPNSTIGAVPGDKSGPLYYNGGAAVGDGKTTTVIWEPQAKLPVDKKGLFTIRSKATVNVLSADDEILTFILTATSRMRQLDKERVEISYSFSSEQPLLSPDKRPIQVRWDAIFSPEISFQLQDSVYLPNKGIVSGEWGAEIRTNSPVEYRSESIFLQAPAKGDEVTAPRRSRSWLPALAPVRPIQIVAISPKSEKTPYPSVVVRNNTKKPIDLGEFVVEGGRGETINLKGEVGPMKEFSVEITEKSFLRSTDNQELKQFKLRQVDAKSIVTRFEFDPKSVGSGKKATLDSGGNFTRSSREN